MKVIVAGGRDFNNYDLMVKSLDEILSGRIDITIVSGKAAGADTLGEKYALEHGLPIDEYPADWKTHGKGAGPIRNDKMARVSQMLVAFWDGKSVGTKDMISRAEMLGLEVHVIKYEKLKTGTIYLSSVANINKLPADCKKFFIARQALTNMEKYDLIWLYRLAPSYDLLKGSKSKQISWAQYVKIYRKEMLAMQPVLDKIEASLNIGESFAFICYCPNADRCHRGLLGDYYKEMGFEIVKI